MGWLIDTSLWITVERHGLRSNLNNHEGTDFGSNTKASAWYKAVATRTLFHHGGFCLSSDTIPQTVLFQDLFDKPLVATFDQPHASSDGGAVLLNAAERQYGIIDGFARCLVDDRQPGKVAHTLRDLLAQRIFGLACG